MMAFTSANTIEKDMIAVRVSRDHRAAWLRPLYSDLHSKPKKPQDLPHYTCINFRHESAGIYRWEFDKGKKSVSVRAAPDGIGLAFVSDGHVTARLSNGSLGARSELFDAPKNEFGCLNSRQ